jgi:hypothetical protein
VCLLPAALLLACCTHSKSHRKPLLDATQLLDAYLGPATRSVAAFVLLATATAITGAWLLASLPLHVWSMCRGIFSCEAATRLSLLPLLIALKMVIGVQTLGLHRWLSTAA